MILSKIWNISEQILVTKSLPPPFAQARKEGGAQNI